MMLQSAALRRSERSIRDGAVLQVDVPPSTPVDPTATALRVCALYPSRLNTYADRGNLMVLAARCRWRGLGFDVTAAEAGDPVAPDAHDLFYVGGGQDRDQAAIVDDLLSLKAPPLYTAVERDKVVLAVCGGFQLLAERYDLGDGRSLPGAGLVDAFTVGGRTPRLIGPCAIETDLGTGPRIVSGFENHGGRTYLGRGVEPFGRVLRGHGNNGEDGMEGVRHRNLIGTYLHGPLLAKNVWLADRLIELALGIVLDPLDNALEDAVHRSACAAASLPPRPRAARRGWPLRGGR